MKIERHFKIGNDKLIGQVRMHQNRRAGPLSKALSIVKRSRLAKIAKLRNISETNMKDRDDDRSDKKALSQIRSGILT